MPHLSEKLGFNAEEAEEEMNITCACCQANQDEPHPIRVGNKRVCRDCAKNGILLSREESETVLDTLKCDVTSMGDVLRDKGYSKREHEAHLAYVRTLRHIARRLATMRRLTKK